MHDGKQPISLDGFSYLPRFMSRAEADECADYFARIVPIWEQRYGGHERGRQGQTGRRLTRPVYWLGAWQFASLGYYAEPDFTTDRCLRAEPYPDVMTRVLERLRPVEAVHRGDAPYRATTSALINFYGDEMRQQPVDVARLRAHRDGEPGPVIMLSVGQPALFEFVDGDDRVHLSVWLRHRSACILSGPVFKEALYHRVTKVKHGGEPRLTTRLPAFRLRRVSVSFRHVPQACIHDWQGLSASAQERVGPYVDQLARESEHFRRIRQGAP